MNKEMNSILEMEDVWKRYKMSKTVNLVVLKEINLSVERGEFIAITGPSGSGKSTMVNMVGALDVPSWGSIKLDGKNINEIHESRLAALRGRTIGFVFQQFNLMHDLTALQNVMLPMEIINIPEKQARERAAYLLKEMGLGERLHHKPNELSGGQQQRVAIARALANDPEVILADEPTGNLDSKTGEFVMNFLGKLNSSGKTIVLVTHDLNLVSYAKRIVHIKDGRVEKIAKNGKSKENKK